MVLLLREPTHKSQRDGVCWNTESSSQFLPILIGRTAIRQLYPVMDHRDSMAAPVPHVGREAISHTLRDAHNLV